MNVIVWLLKNLLGFLIVTIGVYLILCEIIVNAFLGYFIGIIIIVIGFVLIDIDSKVKEFIQGDEK